MSACHIWHRGLCVRPTQQLGARRNRGARLACNALKLYTFDRSRGRIVEWYVKEFDIPAEIVEVRMDQKEHKSDWYRQIHPFGQVPALEDGDQKVFETGAILLHLDTKYRNNGSYTEQSRSKLEQWVMFANTTLTFAWYIPKGRDETVSNLLQVMDDILEEQTYIAGEEFTVADVAVAGFLFFHVRRVLPEFDYTPYAALSRYLNLVMDRPAAKATILAMPPMPEPMRQIFRNLAT